MLRAHRQAWAWQDEYYGLTLEDIRELERQTQLALQEKMAAADAEDGESDDVKSSPKKRKGSLSPKKEKLYGKHGKGSSKGSTSSPLRSNASGSPILRRMDGSPSRGSGHSKGAWRVGSLERLAADSSEDEDEFFDAQGKVLPLYWHCNWSYSQPSELVVLKAPKPKLGLLGFLAKHGADFVDLSQKLHLNILRTQAQNSPQQPKQC